MTMDKKRVIGVLLLCFVLIVAAGCAGLTTSSRKEGASEEKKEVAPRSPTYSEFEDVRIPREMDLDRSESVVYESHNLRMGVLYYSAKAELPETVEFFNAYDKGWVETHQQLPAQVIYPQLCKKWPQLYHHSREKDYQDTHTDLVGTSAAGDEIY